jgi:hypothetical protein
MSGVIPFQYRAFRCAEYFQRYREGRYDTDSQLWFIAPVSELLIDENRGALAIGRPGVDGIDFCYRAGLEGIWAYYPIESNWTLVATSLRELEQGWLNGSISV